AAPTSPPSWTRSGGRSRASSGSFAAGKRRALFGPRSTHGSRRGCSTERSRRCSPAGCWASCRMIPIPSPPPSARSCRRSWPVSARVCESAPMLDPLKRWRPLPDKPDYAGVLSYAGLPLADDPAQLAGIDAAIVGAPTDDLVSDRPGTRFGPRAIRSASCPPGPHLEAGIDAFEVLRVVDYGDAAVIPADPIATHAAIERVVGEVVAAGALPFVLGGDHSITEPCVTAVATARGPVGLLHFDTHTDTGTEVFGVERSHGTPMFRLVEQGRVDGARYAQIGLRGYWPGPAESAWQREHGIVSFFMHDGRGAGIREGTARAREGVGVGSVGFA